MFFIGPFALFVLACPCDTVVSNTTTTTTVVRVGAPEDGEDCKV
jgi:hypothetical protein